MPSGKVKERFRSVQHRVAAAAERVGRRPEEVRIVVACKTFDADAIESALDAGATDLGENYVQEAVEKQERIGRRGRWHLIGALQRNKARTAVTHFEWIHSLDRLRLAETLHRAGESLGTDVRCLLQVHLGGEATKGGLPPRDMGSFLHELDGLRRVRVEGLMTIPPPVDDPEESRPFFQELRRLQEGLGGLRLPNVHLKELSMGMSGDFEVAVEEGATMVRIGAAILGPRERKA